MSEPQDTTQAADGQSSLTDGLDANALNEACWTFAEVWGEHTKQAMDGETWNNLKPMLEAAIKEYLKERPSPM